MDSLYFAQGGVANRPTSYSFSVTQQKMRVVCQNHARFLYVGVWVGGHKDRYMGGCEMVTPCYRFADVSAEDQMEKIRAELDEVAEAYAAYRDGGDEEKWVALLCEIADVQVACETLMLILDANEGVREAVRKLVEHKNAVRGYYDARLPGDVDECT